MLAEMGVKEFSNTLNHVVPEHRLSEEAWRFLNTLRLVGRSCRAKARTDLFEACALLSANISQANTAHAEVLMRCLDQALGKRPILYRPGERSLSFDERWLLQTASALSQQDEASAAFLLRSRVKPHARRNCIYLLRAASDQFHLN